MAGAQLCQIHLKSGPRTFRALSLPTLGHQEHPLLPPSTPVQKDLPTSKLRQCPVQQEGPCPACLTRSPTQAAGQARGTPGTGCRVSCWVCF